MKKHILAIIVLFGAIIATPISSLAQDKFTVTGKADFVSDYIWRGAYQNSGFSVQPNLGLSYKGFTLSAWGSQSITNSDTAPQEYDINLS